MFNAINQAARGEPQGPLATLERQLMEEQLAYVRIMRAMPMLSKLERSQAAPEKFKATVKAWLEDLVANQTRGGGERLSVQQLKILKAAANKVEVISFKEFNTRFTETVKWLTTKLRQPVKLGILATKPVHHFYTERKSELWLAACAWDQLVKAGMKPHCCTSKQHITYWVAEEGVKDFVYFDDALYSGGQLKQTLAALFNTLKQPNSYGTINLYICIPYATTKARERIAQLIQSPQRPSNLAVHLPANMDELKDAIATIEEAKYVTLEQQDLLDVCDDDGPHQACSLTVFQHKAPDNVSLAKPLLYLRSKIEEPYKDPYVWKRGKNRHSDDDTGFDRIPQWLKERLEESASFEVEAIVDHRPRDGDSRRREYQVKYRHYELDEKDWLSGSYLKATAPGALKAYLNTLKDASQTTGSSQKASRPKTKGASQSSSTTLNYAPQTTGSGQKASRPKTTGAPHGSSSH